MAAKIGSTGSRSRQRPYAPKGLSAAPTNSDRRPDQIAPARRAGSWAPDVKVPATVPVWTSSEGWLTAFTEALGTSNGDAIRRSYGPSADTVIAVAEADAAAADTATGRNVCTSHRTVARVLGVSADTVRRCRYVIRDLGYSREVLRGRYLTRREITLASMAHGGRQRRIASTRCLTMPRRITPHSNRPATLAKPRTTLAPRTPSTRPFSHLPPSGAVKSGSSVLEGVPTRVSANGTQKSPRKKQKAAWRAGGGSALRSPRPLHIQKLAAKLIARLPWLGRSGHIGALCDVLSRLPIDHHDPRAHHKLIDVMDAHNRERAMYSPRPDNIRNPIALFASTARAALEWHSTMTPPTSKAEARSATRTPAETTSKTPAKERTTPRTCECPTDWEPHTPDRGCAVVAQVFKRLEQRSGALL